MARGIWYLHTMAHISNHLTNRQWMVAVLVAQGKTNKQIGVYLGTSPLTVRNQVSSILRKIGATRRPEIASFVTLNTIKKDPQTLTEPDIPSRNYSYEMLLALGWF